MKLLRLALFAALAVLAGASTAMAQQQYVVLTSDAVAYQGPGPDTGVAGTIPANSTITVDYCENGYCRVFHNRNQRWIEQYYVDTAAPYQAPAQPQPQPQPPRPQPQPWPWPQPQPPRPTPPPPIFDQPGACFYSERNFQGQSFCVDKGDSYSRLRNWDNVIRSVEVFGRVRVDLCSDASFRGNCVTLRTNASRLPTQLDRRTSSIDVY